MLRWPVDMRLNLDPTPHAIVDNALGEPDRVRLLDSFPQRDSFENAEKRTTSSERGYRMLIRNLTNVHGQPSRELSTEWRALVHSATSAETRSLLGEVFELNLDSLRCTASLAMHNQMDFQARGTGKAAKIFAFVLYLHGHWDPTWGGRLIFGLPDIYVKAVTPSPGRAVAFLINEDSHHEIEPVSTGTAERVSVNFEFWRP